MAITKLLNAVNKNLVDRLSTTMAGNSKNLERLTRKLVVRNRNII